MPLPLFSLKILQHIQVPDNQNDGETTRVLKYKIDFNRVCDLVFEISIQQAKMPIFQFVMNMIT